MDAVFPFIVNRLHHSAARTAAIAAPTINQVFDFLLIDAPVRLELLVRVAYLGRAEVVYGGVHLRCF